jgi:hypothetical protein
VFPPTTTADVVAEPTAAAEAPATEREDRAEASETLTTEAPLEKA